MPRRRHTRRQALQIGATAAAATLLRNGPASGAQSRAGVFEMALDGERGAVAAGGWKLSRVYRAPRRFDLIGLGFPRGTRLEAQVRARTRNGRWTPWTPLHHSGDHAPDRGRASAGTEPVFTGSADVFQLRLRGDARRLRARFVRALPDARRARVARAQRPAQGAPAIIPRADWGGDSCPPRTEASYGDVQLAFVHHTVNANDYSPDESAAIVLGICRYHRNSNGWDDIGYNFLVDRYGQVFEGRAGGIDQAVIGAQAQGWNSHSTGIALIGDMTSVPISDAALDAVASLIAWKLPLHGCPVEGQVTVVSGGGETNRYKYGTPVTFERISGHRDGSSTSCPGDALYAQLADLRARAAARATPVSRLTLRASSTRVRYPSGLSASGTLRFADGSSPGAATVVLELAEDGVTYRSLTAVSTDASGAWRASVALPGSGSLRARFAGDGSRPALESAAVSVELVPKVSVRRSPTRARAGRAVKVTGTWAPEPSSDEIVVEVERQVRGRWKRVSRKRIAVSDTRFSTKVAATRPGLHRVVLKGPNAVVRRSFRAL